MSDAADDADQRIVDAITEGIEKARRQIGHDIPPTGTCYYCSDGVRGAVLFCCKECEIDWDNLQAAKKRNGI